MSIRLRPLVIAVVCAGAACRPLPPPRSASPAASDDADVSATHPDRSVRYLLYKFLQPIGVEGDTFTRTRDGGVEAKAIFTFNDRGSDVPLAASYRLGADGLVRSYDAWGRLARTAGLDDHVRARGDGSFSVRHLNSPAATVRPGLPYAVTSGYAPLLGQDLLARTWIAHGRPARLPLLPAGEVQLQSRGKESYTVDGQTITLEHVAIAGLVWGREDIWLDDKGTLAAVVTRDAEYDHFEGLRYDLVPLAETLVARAGADAVAGLAAAVRSRGDEPKGPVALVNARLIDGSGAPPVADAVIVYEGDRILAAGPRATTPLPPGARQIDLRGQTVLPGLWDMHAHVEQVEQGAAYLAAGVTTVRDEGNIMEFITALRDTIDSGRGIGPRIIVDGLVDGSGKLAVGRLRVDSEKDIAPMIERLVKAGCAELKIYSSLKPELVKPLVAEAHRRGLRVTGHIPEGMTLPEAIDAGYDAFNHLPSVMTVLMPRSFAEAAKLTQHHRRHLLIDADFNKPPLKQLFNQLVEHHTVVDPTIALFELFNYPAEELARREPGLAKMPRELRDFFDGAHEDLAENDAFFKKMLAVLGEMHRRGIPIVAGTDQAVLGHSLHREIELYVEAGFTPMEAIQAATLVPARFMRREAELGTVSAGKRADLIVVDGDPLRDIRDTRKLTLVIARGRSYRPAELWQAAGFTP
jgi:imidazolonepropionase-like amidohydrolase